MSGSESAQHKGGYRRIKREPEEHGNFILEMSVDSPTPAPARLLPMTVPLRATNACPRMRQLMDSFRLDPFTVQNGDGAVRSWKYEDDRGGAGPLTEEPLQFEFQLELTQPLIPQLEEAPEERSPSPLTPLPEEDPKLDDFPPPDLSASPINLNDTMAPIPYFGGHAGPLSSLQSVSQTMYTFNEGYTGNEIFCEFLVLTDAVE